MLSEQKVCAKCGIQKPISEFYKRKNRPCGVVSICKTCSNLYGKEYNKNNRIEILRQAKEYYKKNNPKLCECGCGMIAPIATYTNARLGYKKGMPVRFIKSHNNCYNGGKALLNGYPGVLVKGHRRADTRGYVRETALIAEKVVGKPLSRKIHVHHHDKNTLNNDHSNLVICENQAYHKLLHRRQRALEACGKANWRKCRICKKYDDPNNLIFDKGGTAHRECKREYMRDYYERTHVATQR